jgi:hypothetical protein
MLIFFSLNYKGFDVEISIQSVVKLKFLIKIQYKYRKGFKKKGIGL